MDGLSPPAGFSYSNTIYPPVDLVFQLAINRSQLLHYVSEAQTNKQRDMDRQREVRPITRKTEGRDNPRRTLSLPPTVSPPLT